MDTSESWKSPDGARWRGILLLVLLLGGTGAAHALVRMALVVGSNAGLADEKPLRFAGRDAGRVHAALLQLGALDAGHGMLLLDPTADRLRAGFRDCLARTRALKARGEKVQLLVYFSGHGSGAAFHVAGEAVPLDEVRAFLKDAEADLKVFIADACNSGSLIQAKGAAPGDPAPVVFRDDFAVSGSAILTSSSAGEPSHESRDLQGSLFTHYLLSGLRGGADYDRDGRITLWEAYTHAQAGLRRRLAFRKEPVQTPGFDVDVRGSGRVVLARLDLARARLVLRGVPRGEYRIYEASEAQPVAEVSVDAPGELALALPSASYVVWHSRGGQGMAGYADLRASRGAVLGPRDFSPVPAGHLAVKGRAEAAAPLPGPALAGSIQPRYYPRYPGLEASAPALEASVRMALGRWEVQAAGLTLMPRRGTEGPYALEQGGLGAALGLRRLMAWRGPWRGLAGARAEYWWLEQAWKGRLSARGEMAGGFFGLALERRLGRRLILGLTAETGGFLSYDAGGEARLTPTVPVGMSLGYGR